MNAGSTALFVPGNRPDRFDGALRSGADLVIVDLEDAVPEADKDAARSAAVQWVSGGPGRGVRVNASGTPWHRDDLTALAGHPCVVMVPKAEDPVELERIATSLAAGSDVIALIETARGVTRAVEIAEAHGIGRLAFGSFDLAAELGVAPEDDLAMDWSRSTLVLASARAGLVPPLDGVTGSVRDTEPVDADARRALRLGFGGKLCIHPAQVPVVAAAMRPSEEDVAWATAVVAAAGTGGVAVVDGRMIDKPVVDRARRILARSPRTNAGANPGANPGTNPGTNAVVNTEGEAQS